MRSINKKKELILTDYFNKHEFYDKKKSYNLLIIFLKHLSILFEIIDKQGRFLKI